MQLFYKDYFTPKTFLIKLLLYKNHLQMQSVGVDEKITQ